MDRRDFMTGAALATVVSAGFGEHVLARSRSAVDLEEVTIASLQQAMASGATTSKAIVQGYLARIKALDPKLNSIVEINPDALAIASEVDRERKAGRVRGALHGIPLLIKDNIDTADKMKTTAGSLALLEAPTPQQCE